MIRPLTFLRPAVLVAILTLPGCAAVVADQVARTAARQVVNNVVAERFPGATVQPVTDCIINNASARQIVTVAADAGRAQPSPRSIQVVTDVLQEPGTLNCLSTRALPNLFGQPVSQ
ncbi:hypothetical protein RM543_03530 [Roseicyclus sp. F158]|uniref:Succinate dehydrogenase n=1 Tax=Tropicimonas omnivorans TaxID=3075590 RepID=A0ABU3DDE9_9RHOB|nr:hypothetical protein [Roseicyclus sp. F158]MDT0681745.1 hypothetical protein [Roseicyclus sp. F158]